MKERRPPPLALSTQMRPSTPPILESATHVAKVEPTFSVLSNTNSSQSESEVRAAQRASLSQMLKSVLRTDSFYQRKFALLGLEVASPDLADSLSNLPFTTRAELQQDQAEHPPYGTNLTSPLQDYRRFHQTSGTHGRPLRWLDTAESWEWVSNCWVVVLRAAGVRAGDRVIFPFSFGPFLGFWAAFDGAVRIGAMAIPAGGTSSLGRLQLIEENRADVVCCTPTYALHLADVAAQQKIDLRRGSVRAIIVAGEPGGNIPAVRNRIEAAWGARLFDHHGMTETGPVSYECAESPGGLHIIEHAFIPEVIDPETLKPVPDGMPGELVLTNLGRTASPLIRYRTGDQVVLERGICACGSSYARLVGGIVGRVDDMFTVRGNNVFPSAVEQILRRFTEIAEFRLTVTSNGPLSQVLLELEPSTIQKDNADLCARVSQALHDELHFRAEVKSVSPGVLPRFEMKANRFIRKP